jgi:hypothetical protein
MIHVNGKGRMALEDVLARPPDFGVFFTAVS